MNSSGMHGDSQGDKNPSALHFFSNSKQSNTAAATEMTTSVNTGTINVDTPMLEAIPEIGNMLTKPSEVG